MLQFHHDIKVLSWDITWHCNIKMLHNDITNLDPNYLLGLHSDCLQYLCVCFEHHLGTHSLSSLVCFFVFSLNSLNHLMKLMIFFKFCVLGFFQLIITGKHLYRTCRFQRGVSDPIFHIVCTFVIWPGHVCLMWDSILTQAILGQVRRTCC